MDLISLLVVVLVVCIVLWAVSQLLAAFGIGNPIRGVVIVVTVILLLVWALRQVGISVPTF